jgi:hypothetical protein
MKKLGILIVIVAGIISGCDMLSDHIWTNYIWEVERKHFDPDMLDTGLPIISIDTEGHKTIKSRENYSNATFSLSGAEDPAYDMTETVASIRGRGNTTWWYPKKPYRLKFIDKQSLFGYPKAKSWVLLANHQDPTLMMNTIAFELGERMALPFTNHATHVELVLNGVYEGSYVVTEQVQVGKGRVDIGENKGFLVELDGYYDEEPKFTTQVYRLPVMIKSPEDLTDPSGYDFVKDHINGLEAALSAPDFPDNGYRDLIDRDTFIKFLLINEIVGNEDAGGTPKSVYMYRDKGEDAKICMGPLWDFDRGFGYSGEGNGYFKDSNYHVNWHPFFKRFFDDPDFKNRYKEIWNEYYHKPGRQGITGMVSFIDDMALKLGASQRANFTVWQWLNELNYGNEISKLKSWWNARMAYLDTEINGL